MRPARPQQWTSVGLRPCGVALHPRSVELIPLVLGLAVFVAHFAIPLAVLQWARRVVPVTDTPAARLAGGLATMGFALAVAAPVVSMISYVMGMARVAGAESSARATQLAGDLSTTMNSGVIAAFAAWGFTLLAAALLLRLQRAAR